MNLRSLLFTAVAVSTFSFVEAGTINHDAVQPFPQPQPITVAETAAVTFKPSLQVVRACHPYPAVDVAGETSGGLKGTGGHDAGCKGSGLGSQVYGRAGWHNDLYAIMYAWYFPKDVYSGTFFDKGYHHKWVSVVVWLDNPALEKPKILAVSPTGGDGILKNVPPVCGRRMCSPPFTDYINGTSPMIVYAANNFAESSLRMATIRGGELQDLIMWEQLTPVARDALSKTDFGEKANVPFIDANFKANLEAARPFL